jgi:hypothetical protein
MPQEIMSLAKCLERFITEKLPLITFQFSQSIFGIRFLLGLFSISVECAKYQHPCKKRVLVNLAEAA